MGKQVQIDAELFDALIEYFWSEDFPTGWLANEIRRGLDAKVDKLLARELFSRYKRAPTGEEREQARKAYLDCKGDRSVIPHGQGVAR
ncbi:MAG: complexin-2 [Lachnospiraceae bacterium]|nr:complexin-2 [Ruminococcus sp.]MCM1274224.1 complexin-2 [Lachnospiraceae bacterium]